MMKNNLIIHGHFYQPPRENPWTGLIPRQKSASPYENWNRKITKECYAANTYSRFLDANGSIVDIINNYTYISFNFGPTLLNWLMSYAPTIYAQILEADRLSLNNNAGHGNAIAQAYNHSILPLCSLEDAETQIIWGLKYFESRFNRSSEGFWLPEAAVNSSIIDLLIKQKIKFIILSPWQAEAFCPLGSKKWKPLGDNPIPSDRVYRIDRPQGSIAVFFYNHQLAHGISFEHYLTDADRLYEKLLTFHHTARPDHLVNIATDGEIYGHHEPFGDMCLAALVRIIDRENDFTLSNYGRYLEEHPPTYLAQLKGGENNLGTSWSCFHGVDRWYRDCGCTTGGKEGWNQKWRAPLRDALIHLRDSLKNIFINEIPNFSGTDPQKIRNHYIEVLTNRIKREDFARKYLDKASASNQETLESFFSLLEGQKFSMFMFTSCGWFFADLSGIETIQNLAYAVRAVKLYTQFTEEKLLDNFITELELAQSNIKDVGSGRDIVETVILILQKKLWFGASLFIFRELFKTEDSKQEVYGIFKRESLSIEKKDNSFLGEIEVTALPTLEKKHFFFTTDQVEPFGITLKLIEGPIGRNHKPSSEIKYEVNIGDLPINLKVRLMNYFADKILAKRYVSMQKSVKEIVSLLNFAQKITVSEDIPTYLIKFAEFTLEILIEQSMNCTDQSLFLKEFKTIEELVPLLRKNIPVIDLSILEKKFSRLISNLADLLTPGFEENYIRNICHIIKTCRDSGIQPELTRAQNVIFKLLKEELNRAYRVLEKDKDFSGLKSIRLLINLASMLQINVEIFKEAFFRFK